MSCAERLREEAAELERNQAEARKLLKKTWTVEAKAKAFDRVWKHGCEYLTAKLNDDLNHHIEDRMIDTVLESCFGSDIWAIINNL